MGEFGWAHEWTDDKAVFCTEGERSWEQSHFACWLNVLFIEYFTGWWQIQVWRKFITILLLFCNLWINDMKIRHLQRMTLYWNHVDSALMNEHFHLKSSKIFQSLIQEMSESRSWHCDPLIPLPRSYPPPPFTHTVTLTKLTKASNKAWHTIKTLFIDKQIQSLSKNTQSTAKKLLYQSIPQKL